MENSQNKNTPQQPETSSSSEDSLNINNSQLDIPESKEVIFTPEDRITLELSQFEDDIQKF
jgi:hypothetical protein